MKKKLSLMLLIVCTIFLAGCSQVEIPIPIVNEDYTYWMSRIQAGDSFTEEELEQIPDDVLYDITPQIIRYIDPMLGGNSEIEITKEVVCRGSECLKYETALGTSVVTGYKTTLRSSMTATQSYIPVASLTTKDNHTITMADLGSKTFLSIETGSSKEEIVSSTGITSLNWTGATRGLAFYGTSTDSIAANRKSHNAGSIVIMSNVHYVYDELVDKDSADIIDGKKTFIDPIYASSSEIFLNDNTAQDFTIWNRNSSANNPYIKYNESSATWKWSNNGTDSFDFVSGLTQILASTTLGLFVEDSLMGINLQTDKGLYFDPTDGIGVKASSTNGISIDSNGLYFDASDDFAFSGDNTYTGSNIFDTATTTSLIIENATTTGTMNIDGSLCFGDECSTSIFNWIGYKASDTLRGSADTEESLPAGGEADIKTMGIEPLSGYIRVKFDIKTTNESNRAGVTVRLNDNIIGNATTTNSNSYQTYSQDLFLDRGFSSSTLSLYNDGYGFTTGLIRNFRVYFDYNATSTVYNITN